MQVAPCPGHVQAARPAASCAAHMSEGCITEEAMPAHGGCEHAPSPWTHRSGSFSSTLAWHHLWPLPQLPADVGESEVRWQEHTGAGKGAVG